MASRYVLVIAEGGWPSNQPPKVTRIISCDYDWEYWAFHMPRDGAYRAFLIPREICGIPPSPNLSDHGGLVFTLHKKLEADLAVGA